VVRCFIAINLPDDIRAGVEDVQKRVIVPGVKAVEPPCLHITMYFLGEVEQGRLERVSGGLEKVSDRPQPLSVEGVGAFPRPLNPRVVWVGTRGELRPLHASIETALMTEGFPPDSRFHPHITIGRVKGIDNEGRNELAHRIEEEKDVRLGEFTARTFELMKSTLTPKGPFYEVLKSYRL